MCRTLVWHIGLIETECKCGVTPAFAFGKCPCAKVPVPQNSHPASNYIK